MPEIILSYLNNNNAIPLKATVHQATNNRKNISILYLHGGGMIFGHKDDLPKEYIQLFLETGYDLIMLDYLLAPESRLDEIITNLEITINNFTNYMYKEIGLTTPNYILFGRSAGAYLSLLATKRNNIAPPTRLILFYGYYSLQEAFCSTPSSHYLKMSIIPSSVIPTIIGNKPLTYGPVHPRFLLYLYGRQTGTWLSFLTPQTDTDGLSKYSLTYDDLKKLPPAFLAATPTDYDVPFGMSNVMAELIPSSHLHIVHDREHDFDRDPKNEQAIKTYQTLLSWLQESL